tara:strand:- start:66 stop:470 length:405 start_codon:yes stop_codon:yes gene_type:complete
MIEEKDFLLREVQRITLLLKELISKVTGLDSGNSSKDLTEIDNKLKSNLEISIKAIIDMPENEFLEKFLNINENYLEQLSELIFEIIKKRQSNYDFDEKELIKKNIIIIEAVNKKSKTYSLQRMNMKNILQQHL